MDLLQVSYGLLGSIIGILVGESVAHVLFTLGTTWGIVLGALSGVLFGTAAMWLYPGKRNVLR